MSNRACPQASAVYAAERTAVVNRPLRRFGYWTEIVDYVGSVTGSSWWEVTFPDAALEVVLQRRSRSATFSAATETTDEVGVMFLVDGAGWGLETVLHELAHLAAGVHNGHGTAFIEALGLLWRREAGIEAWVELTDAINHCARKDPVEDRVDVPPDAFPLR